MTRTALVRRTNKNLTVIKSDEYKSQKVMAEELRANGFRVLKIWNGDISQDEIDEWEYLNRAAEYGKPDHHATVAEPAEEAETAEEAAPADVKKEIAAKIEAKPARSAWDKGVKEYALELLDEAQDPANLSWKSLLNGAQNWREYSWGGCSLIYDTDIAERLCSPSELKKCRGGEWRPNRREEWLDVQSRALDRACRWLLNAAKAVKAARA